ncbi:four helix bundle protein [Siansivirga zeaxanthinifaciens]|uniref:four helix bundle protein n=1 Tax=Siansivirga zeaxanthinifaciens TaxID=762954 RepID=UPI0009FEC24A
MTFEMYSFSFEKLDVLVQAEKLSKDIYAIISKFSAEEKFGITTQLRSVSISICSKIAEGSLENQLVERHKKLSNKQISASINEHYTTSHILRQYCAFYCDCKYQRSSI